MILVVILSIFYLLLWGFVSIEVRIQNMNKFNVPGIYQFSSVWHVVQNIAFLLFLIFTVGFEEMGLPKKMFWMGVGFCCE